MDRGKVQVVQPDMGRVGGLTEAKRVCDLAAKRRLTVVPSLENGISIAAAPPGRRNASLRFHRVSPREPFESALRKELVTDELRMEDGVIPLPELPGLGVELNRDALERFKEAAERAAPSLITV